MDNSGDEAHRIQLFTVMFIKQQERFFSFERSRTCLNYERQQQDVWRNKRVHCTHHRTREAKAKINQLLNTNFTFLIKIKRITRKKTFRNVIFFLYDFSVFSIKHTVFLSCLFVFCFFFPSTLIYSLLLVEIYCNA